MMDFVKKDCVVVVAIFTLILTQVSVAMDKFTMEISTQRKDIEIGEPLLVKVNLIFEHPQISTLTKKLSTSIETDVWTLQVQHSDDEPSLYPLVLPVRLNLQDTEGLAYEGVIEVFCHLYREKKVLSKKIIFEKQGSYIFGIVGSKKQQKSNFLDISVKPSILGEKALSFLTDPEDFAFLEGGICKNPKTVSHLEEVVNHCKNTMLARRSSARLGLEYFKDFQKKHKSFEKFKEKLKSSEIEKPLFDKAVAGLTNGVELPDDFPIRAELLEKLAIIEYMKNNYIKANSHLDELISKYPKGKYGKKAIEHKKELLELQKKESK